jgi:multimeric flavodoxin WrbA
MKDRRFLFLLSSTRQRGNAELLARHAAAPLPSNTEQQWLRLSDLPLPDFRDTRDTGGTYPVPDGHGATLLQATLAASDLVFVAPVYWYALPTLAKHYLDHWTGWMRVPDLDFKLRMAGKSMWAVTILSDTDHRFAEPLLGTLRLTADYMDMRWAGSVIGYGNHSGDVLKDKAALAAAEKLFS